MKKLIRYLSYYFLGISLFFIFCNDSYAKAFRKDGAELFVNVNGDPVSYGSHEWSSFKKYDDNGSWAYCSDAPLGFSGTCTNLSSADPNANLKNGCGNFNYSLDTEYADSDQCYYEDGGVGKQGDCSSIVGYIIAESLSATSGYSDDVRWMRTQLAIWLYLGNYGYGNIKSFNAGIGSYWNRVGWATTYIRNAWQAYANANVSSGTSVVDDVRFDVISSDSNFYYYPGTASCDSGFYRTKSFKVKNNENVAIRVNLETTSNNIEICSISDSGTKCSSSKEIIINQGGSVEMFLKANYDKPENFNLIVRGSYESGVRIDKTYYDSERYDPPVSGSQGMIILTTIDKGVDLQIKHITSKKVPFSKQAITRKRCKDSSNSGNGTETNPVSKVCANKSQDSDDYTATFSGCTCLGLDLGKKRYINIILKEKTKFIFGNLTPNEILYAGGGFGFADSSSSGITTQYVSEVSWEYANEMNGIPYYYNGNNLSENDARKIENEINEALEEKIKSSLSLNFSTRDSNDYLNNNMVIVPLKLDINNINFQNGVYEIKSGSMKMHHAYFSSDGRVSYNGQNSTYLIDGGNKYYIPMGYSEAVFPFNISASNLSIVEGINFWYEAECDKSVQDLYKSLYYRSIDLTNPFPKAGNLTANVPENWRFWYCGTGTVCNNITNRNRLENTYHNYPDSPLYEVILDSSKFKKIGAMSDYYTSWSNINAKGVSSFITNMNLFEKYASDKSYCSIGVFSEDCDKY